MTQRHSRWRFVVPAIALSAGLLFGVSAATSQGGDLRPSTQDLVTVVTDANRKVEVQAGQVRNLQQQVDGLTAAKAPGSAQLSKTEAQVAALTTPVGLTPVTGPTVTVTLNDSKRAPDTLPQGANLNWLLVHQQDVQGVVNALWHGGATAMMLMDQRVISTSAVRCVGNTLLLQGRVYSPPFTITAMGNVNELKKSLQDDPAVSNYRDYVALVGIGYDVQTSNKTTLPAYAGSLDLRYAKVPSTKGTP
ncbi:DUF881 domain-containing protein [Leekyejoonella antrihumi]|uniref:DUF881 domain-containing protein n=1 Tax=Leekyejoonella antrihumi TaxID=1660198 RepID=A0A563E6T9_9MICO|nr:DUF881 domain-containing protein [Leekyejoonella antrihumi]TWP38236.1 DUF881 domain-containing protein [Leekyejoonella antrihumi]